MWIDADKMTVPVDAGATLLSVPKRLLLPAHRSGKVGGLQGQSELVWEVAGDLREEVGEESFKKGATWDARLSLAVFEATSGGTGGVAPYMNHGCLLSPY